MKRRDIAVILSLVLLAMIGQGVLLFGRKPAATAMVSVGGHEAMVMQLHENQIFDGTGARGAYRVEISDGRARMVFSDCPDGQCVRQGFIDSAGQSVVCLPNQVVILLDAPGDKTAPDAIAY